MTRPAAAAVILIVSLLIGCESLVDPDLPGNSVVLTPPAVFSRWWQMVEQCSGTTRSLSGVEWYVTTPGPQLRLNGKAITGYWSAASNRIVLDRLFYLDGDAVRHEMLHALIRKNGHPRDYFLDRCGGVVICEGSCAAESSQPAIDPAVPRVSPTDLELSVLIDPAQPSFLVDDGFFTVTIVVRNQTGHDVVSNFAGASSRRTESYAMEVIGSTFRTQNYAYTLLLDSGTIIFKKGETKKQVFDLSIGGTPHRSGFATGTYQFEGMYRGRWAASASVYLSR